MRTNWPRADNDGRDRANLARRRKAATHFSFSVTGKTVELVGAGSRGTVSFGPKNDD